MANKTNITKYVTNVDGSMSLTEAGWTASSKVANALTSTTEVQQWAQLHAIARKRLEGEDVEIFFFLSISRKVANGEIAPLEDIDVDI